MSARVALVAAITATLVEPSMCCRSRGSSCSLALEFIVLAMITMMMSLLQRQTAELFFARIIPSIAKESTRGKIRLEGL